MRSIAIFVSALLCAGAARAQAPADAGLFRLYQGGGEVGRETFVDRGRTMTSTVVIPLLGLRLVTDVQRDESGRATRTEMRAYSLPADTLVRTYVADQDGDTLRMSQMPAHGEGRAWARAARPDAVVASQSVADLVRLVQASGRRDRTWQVWFPSADSLMPMVLQFHGDTADAVIGPQRMTLVLGPGGRVERFEIPVSRVRIERFAGDSLAPLAGMHRPDPDYTAPPGAAYTAEDVRVPVRLASGDTFSLGCTLTRPLAGGPRFPALVTATGSGLQDRDENLYPLVPTYRLFRQVAERVAAVGVATLRCDDRSFGSSGGPVDSVTSEGFADDVAAQVAYLRTRRDINPDRIGVIGHSEGGITGPMVAVRDRRLAAVIIMAGTAKNGVEVLKDQVSWPWRSAEGLSDAERAARIAEAESTIVASDPGNAWMRFFRAYEPLPTARRVRQPVLIVQGAVDRQVTAGQADTLAAAMRAAGNRDVTVRVFPHLNHLFLVSPTDGSPTEYVALTDTAVPADVLDTIAEWVRGRLVRR